MEATCEGHTECVRLLIEHKADVHARTFGRTALNFSKGYGMGDKTACTRLLLEAGADVNAADDDGRTALMHAALYGNGSLSPLLEAGADVNAADDDGRTALMHRAL
jgi:ankyrin repeat protein